MTKRVFWLVARCAFCSAAQVARVGEVVPTRGFSSFKFLPDSGDGVVVALRTLETRERVATFITAFTLAGAVLLPDTLVADRKYEGFEFI